MRTIETQEKLLGAHAFRSSYTLKFTDISNYEVQEKIKWNTKFRCHHFAHRLPNNLRQGIKSNINSCAALLAHSLTITYVTAIKLSLTLTLDWSKHWCCIYSHAGVFKCTAFTYLLFRIVCYCTWTGIKQPEYFRSLNFVGFRPKCTVSAGSDRIFPGEYQMVGLETCGYVRFGGHCLLMFMLFDFLFVFHVGHVYLWLMLYRFNWYVGLFNFHYFPQKLLKLYFIIAIL